MYERERLAELSDDVDGCTSSTGNIYTSNVSAPDLQRRDL